MVIASESVQATQPRWCQTLKPQCLGMLEENQGSLAGKRRDADKHEVLYKPKCFQEDCDLEEEFGVTFHFSKDENSSLSQALD